MVPHSSHGLGLREREGQVGWSTECGGKELTAVSGWYTCGAVSTGVLVAWKTLLCAVTQTHIVAAFTALRFAVDATVLSVVVC